MLSGPALKNSFDRATEKNSDALRERTILFSGGDHEPRAAHERSRSDWRHAGELHACAARLKNICPTSGACTPLYRPVNPLSATTFCAGEVRELFLIGQEEVTRSREERSTSTFPS